MPPKFGYVLDHYGPELTLNPELLTNRTRNVEDIGFDSIWITDHILLPKGSRNPKYETITELITSLAYLGGSTETINLGMSTLVLPARDTILTAKQISTLYYFLGNRLITSFGAGWAKSEFELLNQNFENRGKRFNEQLDVIRALFRGETEFHGKYHEFDDVELKPRGPGLGEYPFYIAGNSEFAFERAEKHGSGWHPIGLTPEEIAKFIDNSDKINAGDVIVRLTLNDQPIEEQIDAYTDLGVEYIVFDDNRDLKDFEKIIQYVRSFQEFQP